MHSERISLNLLNIIIDMRGKRPVFPLKPRVFLTKVKRCKGLRIISAADSDSAALLSALSSRALRAALARSDISTRCGLWETGTLPRLVTGDREENFSAPLSHL